MSRSGAGLVSRPQTKKEGPPIPLLLAKTQKEIIGYAFVPAKEAILERADSTLQLLMVATTKGLKEYTYFFLSSQL